MCVCMQKEPANTATGSIARSSSRTDHAATRNTNHHSTGMYGFHGEVSMNGPYARIKTASTAPNASATPAPPRRYAIHNTREIAAMSSTTFPACNPNDDLPNTIHAGHSA